MDDGQIIKTTLNNVPVELKIISIGPGDPVAIAAVQAQIVNGIPSESMQPIPASQPPASQPTQFGQLHNDDGTMKPWYYSKTLWFNALAIIVAVATNYGYNGQIPEDLAKYVPIGIGIVNIVLRFISKGLQNTGK